MIWGKMPWWEWAAVVAIGAMVAWNIFSGRVHLPDFRPTAVETRVNNLEQRVEDLESWR